MIELTIFNTLCKAYRLANVWYGILYGLLYLHYTALAMLILILIDSDVDAR